MTVLESRKALMEGKITALELVNKTISEFEKDKESALPLNAFFLIYKNHYICTF